MLFKVAALLDKLNRIPNLKLAEIGFQNSHLHQKCISLKLTIEAGGNPTNRYAFACCRQLVRPFGKKRNFRKCKHMCPLTKSLPACYVLLTQLCLVHFLFENTKINDTETKRSANSDYSVFVLKAQGFRFSLTTTAGLDESSQAGILCSQTFHFNEVIHLEREAMQ